MFAIFIIKTGLVNFMYWTSTWHYMLLILVMYCESCKTFKWILLLMFHCFIAIRTMIIWWTEEQSNPISVHLSTRVTFFILADSSYIHLRFALLLIASFVFIVQPVHKAQEFCWGKYWCSSVRIVGRIIRRFR